VDQQRLLEKLAQIEEQAQRTLDEFPRSLTKERLRMILSIARYLRIELSPVRSNEAQADIRAPDPRRSSN
jgi:hypothetical protein